MITRNADNKIKKVGIDSPPGIETKLDPARETHWIKYCEECPASCACKDYDA